MPSQSRYQENRDHYLNYQKKRYHDLKTLYPELFLLDNARRRARSKGIEYNLTLEDIQIPERCPILDIPLVINKGKVGPDSPTLDRIDINQGYIKGNVAVISYRANANKSDMTVDVAERLLRYMKKEKVNK